eukprot:g4615.t1
MSEFAQGGDGMESVVAELVRESIGGRGRGSFKDATADGARSRSAIIATPKPALHKKHERCETAGASNLRDLLLDISKGAVRSPSSLTADPRLFFMKHYISLPAVKQPAGRQRRRK